MRLQPHEQKPASLYDELSELARPRLEEKRLHPVVRSLLDGSLDPAVMRRWLEQDYLYLHGYARTFARLASLAPDNHIETLIDGAHYTMHTEIPRVHELADLFDADLSRADLSTACAEYGGHLTASAAHYETGVISVLPCMIGFSAIGLIIEPPDEPRYRRWVEIYSAGDFQGYARRFADLVDDLVIEWETAAAVFEKGMQMELALWEEAASFVG